MFDYKCGKAGKSVAVKPRAFLSKVKTTGQGSVLPVILALEFLDGAEVAKSCIPVSKAWHRTLNQSRVWETFSYAVAPAEVVNKFKRVWKCEFSAMKAPPADQEAALMKFTFASLMLKTCAECWQGTKAMRICSLLGRALCIDCQKLQKFTMISAEQVAVDYKLTEEMLTEEHIRGLTVAGKHRDGHEMTVYYLRDVEQVKNKRGEHIRTPSVLGSGAEQARRSEVLRHFAEFGVTHKKFLKLCFETPGNPAYNYVRNRSQQTARKIAKKLANMYEPWLRKTQSFMESDPEDKPT